MPSSKMQEPDTVVHVLHEGFALCGFSKEVPARWPYGHKFVTLDGHKVDPANCPPCTTEADQRIAAALKTKGSRR
jgi:hypothetical protein